MRKAARFEGYRGGMAIQEVRIRSALDEGDYLSLRAEPWNDDAAFGYEGPDVTVVLSRKGLNARSVLPAYIADAERLPMFFREIDRDWRGWIGEKRAGLLGRDWLSASATHDGRGHVALTFHLAAGWPDTAPWSARAVIPIDVGSAAEYAKALDDWVTALWPPERRWRTPAE